MSECPHSLKPVASADCRSIPAVIQENWMIKEVTDTQGFDLILKYQSYPWMHEELAKRVAN
jgi:hypothetical protein